MMFLLVVLAVVGGIVVASVAVGALYGLVEWWHDREMRRWPTPVEWMCLERLVQQETPNRRDPARIALRKLRYKYARKTNQ